MGEREIHIEFWMENLLDSDHPEDQERDGTIILKRVFEDVNWIAAVRDRIHV
jgi:hypothetical protein